MYGYRQSHPRLNYRPNFILAPPSFHPRFSPFHPQRPQPAYPYYPVNIMAFGHFRETNNDHPERGQEEAANIDSLQLQCEPQQQLFHNKVEIEIDEPANQDMEKMMEEKDVTKDDTKKTNDPVGVKIKHCLLKSNIQDIEKRDDPSYNNNSSKIDYLNKSDIIDESPQADKEKDSKILVTTPDRRRSAKHKSLKIIRAAFQDEKTIESLVAKMGSKYLVKWENFTHDQNTWEPRSAIPPFIVKFYEQDLNRLGRKVLAPATSGSEYISAVGILNEISDSGYKRDDDWRPRDKKRLRKSSSSSKIRKSSKTANDIN